MRSFITLVALLALAAGHAAAQAPRTIGYQGVLADPFGNLIPDGNHSITMRLYDAANAASAIYGEKQTVPVVHGVFNAIIGSVTPLPASLAFDRAYFVGVSVDDGAELSPRIPLTAVPYAIHAAMADEVSSTATSVVRSLNGQQGAVTLQGTGSTTVTQSAGTITISSTGGSGGGIQGVQSSDGAIAISNPGGPIAAFSIAKGGITEDKIAAGAVTSDKIKDGTVTQGKIAAGVALPPNG